MFAFLYAKVNSKKISEEISFPSFFQENAAMSAFLLRFKANRLTKIHGYAFQFFFLDSISPVN